jgi:hypothetical protein
MQLTKRTITANDGAKLVVWDNYNAGTPIVYVHGFP